MAESQEDSEQERQVCLKCGKGITHIPYKYGGQHFHARCLICSTCGKKLVGKPFVTEANKIFCGEQCQISYQESQVQTSVVEDKAPSPALNGDSRHNESFLEALQSTEQAASNSSPVSRPHPQLQPPDIHIERITDYPCHTGSPTSQSPGSTRRSSLSVSESSLTSEGSVGFDASRKPGKRILKKPHGPRKHKSNRVHWRLPEEGGDTMSLESFESSSTTSSLLYQQARNGIVEARQNWREFERSPPPGSTGLTPARSSRENLLHVSHQGDRSPSPTSPPHSPARGSPRHGSSGGEGAGVAGNVPKYGRTVSPLQYSMQMHSPPHTPPSASQQTSTPLREHSSASPSRVHTSGQANGGGPFNSVPAPTFVPLLTLDHSNLSELEASTTEDRKKSHLFAIPYPPRSLSSTLNVPPGAQNKQNGPPNYSGFIPPVGMEHMCEDDADDYDHLSPLKMAAMQPTLPPPPAKNGPTDDYGDSDIDEALDELQDSLSSQSSSAPQSPTADITRPLSPGQQRERSPRLHSGPPNPNLTGSVPSSVDFQRSRDLIVKKPLPPPVPSKSTEVLNFLQHEKQLKTSESQEEKNAPPPVPPKMRRRKTPESSDSTSPPAQSSARHPITHSTTIGTSGYPHSQASHPPPEFATTAAQVIDSSDPSQDEVTDDALSSISNATLVAEQEESSPNSHTTEQNTPRLKTKFDQVGGPGEGRGRGRAEVADAQTSHFSESATLLARVAPTSAHVHPEVFYPTSSSSSSSSHQHQSWNSSSQKEERMASNHLPYHLPQPYYSQETRLPSIDENLQPERKSVISVSNSSSDSSLRGTSPPEKVSHTMVQTRSYSHSHRYSSERERMGIQGTAAPRRPPNVTSAPPHTITSSAPLSQPMISTTTMANRLHTQAPYNQSPPMGGTNFFNVPPGSPRKRGSMDKAYNEGNMLTRNHRLYHSQRSALAPRARQRFHSVEDSSKILDAPWGATHSQQYHTIGSPRGLRYQPTNFFTSSWDGTSMTRTNSPPHSFSQDDSRLLEPFYPALPGGKLMSMKPEIHDTEGVIQRMLADVESSGSEEELSSGKKKPYGPCAVCHKVIYGAKTLKIHEKVRYHTKCFKCAVCGVSLLGQKPYKIGEKLFCNDHNSLSFSHPTGWGRRQQERQSHLVQGHSTHHEPHPLTSHSHNLHPHPSHPHTGQITSV